MSERAITHSDLPTHLQAHYTRVYAAVLVHTDGPIDGRDHDRADGNAWEAVRLANGGVLPAAPERDAVAEGIEIARRRLEADVVDAARCLTVWPGPLAVAFEALLSFEAQHGRRQ
jgi:hypothetical protein